MKKAKVSIACVGLNVVDCYEHQGSAYPGGNEYNVSIFASRLGAQTSFIGCFGPDFYSGANYAFALEAGVDLSHCRFYHERCGMAVATLKDGDRVFAGGNRGGVTARHPIELTELDLAFLQAHDITVSDRYSRMNAREFEKMHQNGVKLAYDFGDEELDELALKILPFCTYAFFSCSQRSEQQIGQLVQTAFAQGCRYVLATLGERGVRAYVQNAEDPFFCAAPKIQVLDTMGAGDSFLAAFLVEAAVRCGLKPCTKDDWMACLWAGTRFASENCTYYGSIGRGLPYPVGGADKEVERY